LEDPISKNEKGAAGVTQGVGPEFKQQCRKKKRWYAGWRGEGLLCRKE
jgi:hypothetical protein